MDRQGLLPHARLSGNEQEERALSDVENPVEHHIAEVEVEEDVEEQFEPRCAAAWRRTKVTLAVAVVSCVVLAVTVAVFPRPSIARSTYPHLVGLNLLNETQQKWFDGILPFNNQEDSLSRFKMDNGEVDLEKVSKYFGSAAADGRGEDQPEMDAVLKLVIEKKPEAITMAGLDANLPLLGAQDTAHLADSLSLAKDRIEAKQYPLRAIR